PLRLFITHSTTTEIYTLSLHDALPIYERHKGVDDDEFRVERSHCRLQRIEINRERDTLFPAGIYLHTDHSVNHRRIGAECIKPGDRKSTRLNSSHDQISYAVFCLKKKI